MGELWPQVQEVLRHLFNGQELLRVLGQPGMFVAAIVALNLIVFTETGLLIGFFLPGDSLLVTAGVVAYTAGWNIPLLLVTLCISAVVGDTVGYHIGYVAGPRIFNRENSLLFRKDHLLAAQAYYDKHGPLTIVYARFVPFLRTFAPVVAGVGRMNYGRFIVYNIAGGVGWVTSMILLGCALPASIDPLMKQLIGPEFNLLKHIEIIILLVVAASLAPLAIGFVKQRYARKANATKLHPVA